MALLYFHNKQTLKPGSAIWKLCSAYVHQKPDKILDEVKQASADDLPVEMENPFEKEKPQCVLCKYKIDANFKNVRLLSQFVSRFTGRIYGRHITGLCEYQHQKVEMEIKKARTAGLMGTVVKDPKYYNDPDLYDTAKPFRYL